MGGNNNGSDDGNDNTSGGGLTRRGALAAGLAGAAVLAVGAEKALGSSPRMPVVYLPHGGGPWPFVEMGLPRSELDGMSVYLRNLRKLPPAEPRALLVISAHWEEDVPTVTTSTNPPLLFDYYGFPPESYRLTWPAPGHPDLAARVQYLLRGAGFPTATDEKRGYDHGTFVPLKVTYPDAHIPVVQLSLKTGLDPAVHLAMGRALRPLRDEGVFIVGSGMSYHNMRGLGDPRGRGSAEAFDRWLHETAALPAVERDARLAKWSDAPSARACHPREEHLLPLMVCAGAGGDDKATVPFSGSMMGMRISAVHFG